MNNQPNLPKCPYCNFRSADREDQKKHLRKKHHDEMVEVAKRGNQDIEWAIGMTASYFTF